MSKFEPEANGAVTTTRRSYRVPAERVKQWLAGTGDLAGDPLENMQITGVRAIKIGDYQRREDGNPVHSEVNEIVFLLEEETRTGDGDVSLHERDYEPF